MRSSILVFLVMFSGLEARDTRPQQRQVEIGDCSILKILQACIRDLITKNVNAENINIISGCANQLRVDELSTQRASIDNLCSNNLLSDSICANGLISNQIDASRIDTQNICANNANLNNVCANNVKSKDMCITGTLRNCSPFSARVALSANTLYNLGDIVPFDQILSDPSGTFQFGPTRFVAPETGTYILTAQVNQQDLTGPNVITGTPIASLEVYVNNILRRDVFLPYLAFNNSQTSLNTSLIFLTKGDEVTIKYRVFVLDQISGFMAYPGQVTLLGNPGFAFRSFLSIHYLSSDCATLDCPCDVQECRPFTPCDVQPCNVGEPCNLQPCPCPPCFP